MKRGTEIMYREKGRKDWLKAFFIKEEDHSVLVESPRPHTNGDPAKIHIFKSMYEIKTKQ